MSDAKKLSSMDASFLYLETPEMPMHVGSMAIFRLPGDYKGDFFEDFKAMIAWRLHVAPILKARLEKTPLDIDHPSWVEDDQFDIDRHIFRGSLPAPHDRATTHGLALNITVQSYRDQLDFGFIAGANIIPHVQVLCDMLPGEFAALEAAYAPPP